MSRYGGPGWTWDDMRQEYYFHQYGSQTPDLNYRSPHIRKQMKVSSPTREGGGEEGEGTGGDRQGKGGGVREAKGRTKGVMNIIISTSMAGFASQTPDLNRSPYVGKGGGGRSILPKGCSPRLYIARIERSHPPPIMNFECSL